MGESSFFSPAQPKNGDRCSRTLWNLQAGFGLAVGPEANGVISLGLVSSSVKWHSSLSTLSVVVIHEPMCVKHACSGFVVMNTQLS